MRRLICALASVIVVLSSAIAQEQKQDKRSYIISAGKILRPQEPYLITVTILKSASSTRLDRSGSGLWDNILPTSVEASIAVQDSVVLHQRQDCFPGETIVFNFKISQRQFSHGNVSVRVEGTSYGDSQGSFFSEVYPVRVHRTSPSMTFASQKRSYHPGDEVRLRCVILDASGQPWTGLVDFYLYNPYRDEMFQWLARNLRDGVVHLSYDLGRITPLGQWTVYARIRNSGPSSDDTSTSHINGETLSKTLSFEVKPDPRSFHSLVLNLDTRGKTLSLKRPQLQGRIRTYFKNGLAAAVPGHMLLSAEIPGSIRPPTYLQMQPISVGKSFIEFAATINNGKNESFKFFGDIIYSIDFSGVSHIISQETKKVILTASYTSGFGEVIQESSTITVVQTSYLFHLQPSACSITSGLPMDIWVTVVKLSSEPFRFEEIKADQLKIWAHLQCSRKVPEIPPTPLQLRLQKQSGGQILWKTSIEASLSLARHAIKDCHMQVSLKFNSLEGKQSKVVDIPVRKELYAIQLSTSSKNIKVGDNLILHARGLRPLGDLHVRIFAQNQLVLSRTVTSGQSLHKLVTFHVRVLESMAPQAKILVWHDLKQAQEAGELFVSVERPVLRAQVNTSALNASQELELAFSGLTRGSHLLLQDLPKPRFHVHLQRPVSEASDDIVHLSDTALPPVLKTFQWPLCQCQASCMEQRLPNLRDTDSVVWHDALLNRSNKTSVLRIPRPRLLDLKARHLGLEFTTLMAGQVSGHGQKVVPLPEYIDIQLRAPEACFTGEKVQVDVLVASNFRYATQEVVLQFGGQGNFSLSRNFQQRSSGRSLQLRLQIAAHSTLSEMITIEAHTPNEAILLQVSDVITKSRASAKILARPRNLTSEVQCLSQKTLQFRGVNSFQLLDFSQYWCQQSGAVHQDDQLTAFPTVLGAPVQLNGVQADLSGPRVAFWLSLDALSYSSPDLRKQLRDSPISRDERLQALLAHRHETGYFTYQTDTRKSVPSLWFTNVALRALHSLSPLRTIDNVMLKRTLTWLTSHQKEDGSFQEIYLYEGLHDEQLPIHFQREALTADILITLAELQNEKSHWGVGDAINAASAFVISRLTWLDRIDVASHRYSSSAEQKHLVQQRVFTAALVARALQVVQSHGEEAAFEVLAKYRQDSSIGSCWGAAREIGDNTALAVQATSLALQVYVSRGEHRTEDIVSCLGQLHRPWPSYDIQTHVYNLQAMTVWRAKYLTHSQLRADLSIGAKKHNHGLKNMQITGLKRESLYLSKKPLSSVMVRGQGSGTWVIQHWSTRTLGQLQDPNVRLFSEGQLPLSISGAVQKNFLDADFSLLETSINIRWNCPHNMSVSGPILIKVEIPTGFVPIINDDEDTKLSSKLIVSGSFSFILPMLSSFESSYQITFQQEKGCVENRKPWIAVEAETLLAPVLTERAKIPLPDGFTSNPKGCQIRGLLDQLSSSSRGLKAAGHHLYICVLLVPILHHVWALQ